MKAIWIAIAAVVVSIAGCTPVPTSEADLHGAWLTERNGIEEGFVLHAGGHMSLIGIASMQGVAWSFDPQTQKLSLSTNTERYPEPQGSMIDVESITDGQLTLTGTDYFAGTYRNADSEVSIISGEVLYRERIAMPPESVVRVTLEDVSLADAPSTLVANTTILMGNRQVPVPFVLAVKKSKVDARHRYSIRATISANNQLQFTTTRHYGVNPMQPSSHSVMLQKVSPAKQVQTSQDMVFKGQLPSATNVVQQTLILKPDNTYRLASSFEGKPDIPAEFGSWKKVGPQLILGQGDGKSRQYRWLDSGDLEQLNQQAQPIKSDVSYVLSRVSTSDISEPSELVLTGDYRYMADAAIFQECASGKRFPVAQDQGGLAMEQEYSKKRSAPGEPLKVTLVAKIEPMPPMEGETWIDTLVISNVKHVFEQADATCD
ncbi:YbaY family lipoprotein [Echinimonas agarilytica]|uniref:YbaY family lipoprotein n=1 Tax=Echinimonas agarilytica TaxID=1215918 RepID=A0AA41W4S5_9GAMM|nr:YbaY family lipoprotein [Echinimonas agarilytica]MCM2678811.1 YbaY family lipoprotein [Echinimonas agarilytica]